MLTRFERPDLIVFQADTSARTQFVLPNQTHIESLPFDGMVINIPASYSLMSPGYVVTRADLRAWLPALTSFNEGKSNYLQVNVDRPGDLFDDAAWAQVVQNWRLLGEAAEKAGFAGILFDNEEYSGRWQDYVASNATYSLAQAQAMASQRGREIMAALAEVMPEGQIAFAHGPYLSVPTAEDTPDAFELQAGDWTNQELRGPFFTGFLDAMGDGQRLIDAGELYALRSAADFARSLDYRNTVLPGRIDWAVNPDALANWVSRVDQGHMVYTDEFPAGYRQSPGILRQTLLNAFDNSETAVFLYSEIAHLGWLVPGDLPQSWLRAVEQAVELADNTLISDNAGDVLTGSTAMDRLKGFGGADTLRGGGDNDMIFGGAGDDFVNGGGGNDTLHGGWGADRFVFGAFSGQDRILSFNPLTDAIALQGNSANLSYEATEKGLLIRYEQASLLLLGVTVDPDDLLIS